MQCDGRRTGAAMPREGEVPLTQEGYEDMDAYFDDPPRAAASVRRAGKISQPQQNQHSWSPKQYSQSQQPPSSASRRPRPAGRPDVAHEIGLRGRSIAERGWSL